MRATEIGEETIKLAQGRQEQHRLAFWSHHSRSPRQACVLPTIGAIHHAFFSDWIAKIVRAEIS